MQEIRPLNQVTLPGTGNLFGFDLDMDGDRVLIGAPKTTRDGVWMEGAAYIFELENGVWVQRERFEPPPSPVAPGEQPGFQFGYSVHMGPDADFVGMTYYIHSGNFMGGSFVFDRTLGETVCEGQPNSTGAPAVLDLFGSTVAEAGSLRVEAAALPPGTSTLLVVGRETDFTPMLGGGAGDLCISANGIARLGLTAADPSGAAQWQVDTSIIPRPGGAPGITAGDTLVFQAWYRDFAPTPTSNLTEARRVQLR